MHTKKLDNINFKGMDMDIILNIMVTLITIMVKLLNVYFNVVDYFCKLLFKNELKMPGYGQSHGHGHNHNHVGHGYGFSHGHGHFGGGHHNHGGHHHGIDVFLYSFCFIKVEKIFYSCRWWICKINLFIHDKKDLLTNTYKFVHSFIQQV